MKIYAHKRAKKALSLVLLGLFTASCAMQSPYETPAVPPSADWSSNVAGADNAKPAPQEWWRLLNDPALDNLIPATFANNPTLDQAMARIDQARAQVGANRASYFPQVGIGGNTGQTNTRLLSGNSAELSSSSGQLAGEATTSAIGPTLTWEIDLFGRIRSSVQFANHSLDARTSDAEDTKLSLATQVANTVLDLRACQHASQTWDYEVASYRETLLLVQKKLSAGLVASVTEASARRDLATAEINRATQEQTCAEEVNALVALSGRSRDEITQLVQNSDIAFMPVPPKAKPQLPALVLASNPAVRAADQDATAAWANIHIAKANRLPKLDLTAALTGNWISASGTTINYLTRTLGANISATVFDGSRLDSQTEAAEGQYREAAGKLRATLRTTVQDVENALVEQKSATSRVAASTEAAIAAQVSVNANERAWRSGNASLLELEDSRRQLITAEDNAISAARDRAKAWVDLVHATGNSIIIITENVGHDKVSSN
jgi:multidrug efflux system outer membrane protein